MSATSSRLHHLDALRNFCMLYGVFVHAGTFFADRPLEFIQTFSGFFRMATFFLVSGFLIALVAARMNSRDLVRRRALALLLPFATLVMLINPVTNYLIYIRFNPWMSFSDYIGGGWRLPAEGNGVWHLHLWFLATLFLFVYIHKTLRRVAKSKFTAKFVEFVMKLPPDITILVIGVSCGIVVTALRMVFKMVLFRFLQDSYFIWIILTAMIYVPYFTLGMILETHRTLFDRLHRISVPSIVLGVLATWTASMVGDIIPERLATVAKIMADELMTVANIAAGLWIARRLFQGYNAIVELFSRAMYTIYLVHFVLIFSLGHLLAPLITNDVLLYLVLSVATIGAGLAVHVGVVERSDTLRLILNGRRRASA